MGQSRKWRTSEKIIVAVVAAPFVFLAWSAMSSSRYDADMEQKVRSSFQPVACAVTSASYTELRTRRDMSTQTGGQATTTMVTSGYDVHVEYSYSVDGQPYVSKRIKPRYQTIPTLPEAQAFDARYPARAGYTCYYDPANPAVAFLEK